MPQKKKYSTSDHNHYFYNNSINYTNCSFTFCFSACLSSLIFFSFSSLAFLRRSFFLLWNPVRYSLNQRRKKLTQDDANIVVVTLTNYAYQLPFLSSLYSKACDPIPPISVLARTSKETTCVNQILPTNQFHSPGKVHLPLQTFPGLWNWFFFYNSIYWSLIQKFTQTIR